MKKILRAKIILKNGKVLKSRCLVEDKESKVDFQNFLRDAISKKAEGNIQIGKLILRFEDVSAIWIR